MWKKDGKLTAQQPITRPYACIPASDKATLAAVMPLRTYLISLCIFQETALAYEEMSSSGPSHSKTVTKRSIADFGSRSSLSDGSRA